MLLATRSAAADIRLSLPVPVLAAVIGYGIYLFAPPVLADGDTYWHVTAGGWMLRHGAVPFTDPFSYSRAGAPWVAHEWLSEVLMALAYRGGGWDGVVALGGGAFALTLGMLAFHLERWVERLSLVLLLLLGAICISPSLLARPHILALPVLEMWTAGLLIARSRGEAPSPLLLPLMPVWANLHGSFIFGLAFTVPMALEALAAAGRGTRGRVARQWGVFIAAATVAALATPHFWHGLVFPFQLMRMRQLAFINEWQPTNFGRVQPIELALMTLLYAALSRRIRLPPLRLLLVLGLLHLALSHARHQMLAGVVGALVLAEPVGQAFARSGETPRSSRMPGAGWMLAGLAVMLSLTAARAMHPIRRTDSRAAPIAALAHVPEAVARTPVFNDYGFGGYLIFKGVRPFIDGRADMYGDDFLAAYLKATRPDPKEFRRIAAQYGVRWTILPAGSPAVAMLDEMPGWQRLYADSTAVVHVRRDEAK